MAVLDADPRVKTACPKILFAPRFAEVIVEAPTFDPPGDSRELGVQLHAINVGGTSVFGLSQYVCGAWGQEPRADGGWFRWLGGRAVVRVAIPTEVLDAVEPAFPELAGVPGVEEPPLLADLQLCAEAEKLVTITSGRYRVRVTVGPEPRWVRIPLGGEVFDVINNAGSVLIEDGFGGDRGYLQIDDGGFDVATDVFNWCGGGVLLRGSYLEDAGLFDERFFLYYEDSDLSWRGQALGWRYRYEPTSVIRHLHAASSGEGSDLFQFYVERNRLLMLVKNAPFGLATRAVIGFVTATASYARRDILPPLLRRRRPPLRHVHNRLRSLKSFLTLAPAMVADRRRLRHRRLRNDAELAKRWLPRSAWTAGERKVSDGAGERTRAQRERAAA